MGRSGPGRIIAIVVSVAITALVSLVLWKWFHDSAFLDDVSMSTWMPASENAETVRGLYTLIFWLAGAVFIGIMALTLAFSLMFRERPGAEALQTHGNSRLEILWTFIPVIIVVVMAVPTFNAITQIQGDAPEGALEIVATGHQWWFEFEYPEHGVVTANEMHVPVDTPIRVALRSVDVIHSFWSPRLMGKVDMMPGHENQLWFTPTETGEFLGQCAEFCGLSHANMKFRIFVDSQADFDAWVQAQTTPAPAPAEGDLAAEGLQQFTASGCIGCHTIAGNDLAAGEIGPNLSHIGSRTTIAAGMMPNTPENLAKWLGDPPGVKPGSLMPDLNLSPEQIEQLSAYLYGLQ